MAKNNSSLIYVAKKKKISIFIKFVVVPLTVFATLVLGVGIYSFVKANQIMRHPPKQLESFANNILPSFSVSYFTSLDNSTNLTGWYFPSKTSAFATIIMVHGSNNNRLQFDSDTVVLYDYFVNNGYNVLSFDLRHSGDSLGNLSTYGYNEWEDVISAIVYANQILGLNNIILYGFNSGVSASLIAYSKLSNLDTQTDSNLTSLIELNINQSIIKGFILDSPLSSSDDYIKYQVSESIFGGDLVGQYTIPFAIRLSAGSSPEYSLLSVLSRAQVPVHILTQKYEDQFLLEKSEIITKERIRLFPNQTTVYTSESTNLFSFFLDDKVSYVDSIDYFLKRFISFTN